MGNFFKYKASRDFSGISTIEELRTARKEIENEVREKEYQMKEQVNHICYMFDPARILTAIYAKFDILENIYNGALKGYHFIKEFIANKRAQIKNNVEQTTTIKEENNS